MTGNVLPESCFCSLIVTNSSVFPLVFSGRIWYNEWCIAQTDRLRRREERLHERV